jgi:uncharacterized protein (TIGR00725 family)
VRQIAVIGTGKCRQDSEVARLAEEVGGLLAQSETAVVCGGLAGAMEAACRGAREAGGTAIGILPGNSIAEANTYCTHVIASGIGHARNLAVVASGEAVIAVGGEWGTLSEIGLARSLGRAVIVLCSWELDGQGKMEGAPGVLRATSPRQAVELALDSL